MKHDAVEQLKHEAWTELRIIRACSTCRHAPRGMYGIGSPVARCGATNNYLDHERFSEHYACGKSGKLWEPMPPKPPGFWKRLGDAIIDRIESGKKAS